MNSNAQESLNYMATFVVRLVVGVIFAAHGAQKLFGLFGGSGFQATADGFANMGFAPGWLWGGLAGCAELFGGLGLLAGLFARLAALGLVITMAVAVCKVHWARIVRGKRRFRISAHTARR